MKNKEVMDKLQAYFLTQDPSVVAKCLASMYVDVHRMCCLNYLPEKEKVSLSWRIKAMSDELQKFILNGPDGDIQLHKMNSDDL